MALKVNTYIPKKLRAETMETDHHCVVCGGMLMQRRVAPYERWFENEIIKTALMSRAVWAHQGFHCKQCGLEYYDLPEWTPEDDIEKPEKLNDTKGRGRVSRVQREGEAHGRTLSDEGEGEGADSPD